MPILVVGTEKNFAALRSRLFEGKVSSKVAREVAHAIREANPHVDLDKLEPGTVLTVPDAPEVAVHGDLSLDETSNAALEGLSKAGKEAIKALASAASARAKAAQAERRNVIAALDGDAVQRAASSDEKLASDLASARERIEEAEVTDKERAARLKRAQREWAAGLDALTNLID